MSFTAERERRRADERLPRGAGLPERLLSGDHGRPVEDVDLTDPRVLGHDVGLPLIEQAHRIPVHR